MLSPSLSRFRSSVLVGMNAEHSGARAIDPVRPRLRVNCPFLCACAHVHGRPGFDDFLHKLGSRGLCYRLQRICDVLPAELLEVIRRNTPVTVVGGPVTPRLSGTSDVEEDSIGVGFDEFVLCNVFRADREGRGM